MSAKTNKRREETSCAHFNKTWMLGKYAMCILVLLIFCIIILELAVSLILYTHFSLYNYFRYIWFWIMSNALIGDLNYILIYGTKNKLMVIYQKHKLICNFSLQLLYCSKYYSTLIFAIQNNTNKCYQSNLLFKK